MSRLTTHPLRQARRRRALTLREDQLARWEKMSEAELEYESKGQHVDLEAFRKSKIERAKADIASLSHKLRGVYA